MLIYPDIFRALGLQEGDAHVIRNAGGRASDALRSIIISQQLLGTREIVVIHHVRPLFSHHSSLVILGLPFFFASRWLTIQELDRLRHAHIHR